MSLLKYIMHSKKDQINENDYSNYINMQFIWFMKTIFFHHCYNNYDIVYCITYRACLRLKSFGEKTQLNFRISLMNISVFPYLNVFNGTDFHFGVCIHSKEYVLITIAFTKHLSYKYEDSIG